MKKIFKEIYCLWLYVVDSIACLGGHKIPDDVRQRVLVVKLDAIGDFILWTNVARALRELYPTRSHQLILVGNSSWTMLAEQLAAFDEVVPVDRKRFFRDIGYRFSTIRRIRRLRTTIAVHPTFSRDFCYGDTIIRASGARERIGSEGDTANQPVWQRWVSDRWYTRLLSASAEHLMELERNAEFMRGLGLVDCRAGMPELLFSAPLPADFAVQKFFILFPGASLALKRWPVERFADLARRVHAQTGWTAIICGGSGEESIGASLYRQLDVPAEDWTGRTSLLELIGIIQRARVLVGNDTSAIHIAAAVGTPAVCIVGGGHFGRFLPYRFENAASGPVPIAVAHQLDCFQCNWQCVKRSRYEEAAPCVGRVEVGQVLAAVTKLIASRGVEG